jgi:hypothetical protein
MKEYYFFSVDKYMFHRAQSTTGGSMFRIKNKGEQIER